VKSSDRFREHAIPAGLALACLCTYLIFLIRYGEMFYWGSDLVANTAYGVTLFSGVLSAGWAVPKPAEMFLFGTIYRMTGSLWFIHLAVIGVTALTVWAGCRLILRHYGSPLGCIAFFVFMTALPKAFNATLAGGAGVLNAMFLLLAILCLSRPGRRADRILALVFLSMANLSRPDSWPCTLLIILLFLLSKVRGPNGPGWTWSDLWFLVPLGMPLIWAGVGAAFFGDPLYSMHVARNFTAEVYADASQPAGGGAPKVSRFLPHLQSSLFGLFSVPGWLSARTAVLTLLTLTGMGAMLRKDARTLLLIGCPIGGTLLFYFLYALMGSLFRADYLYALLVFTALITSVGVGAAAGLARKLPPRRWSGWAQTGIAGAILLFLAAGAVRGEIVSDVLPQLRNRAAAARWSRPAVERLVEDIRRGGGAGTPIVLSTHAVPPSRIALRLGTGKGLYLVERLVGKQRVGEHNALPALKGRTVYYCFQEPLPEDVGEFLRPLIEVAPECKAIYRHQGLMILKCSH
jgi:hypothetical protein